METSYAWPYTQPWTTENRHQLIKLYKLSPVLWDTTNEGYTQRDIKRLAYQTIGDFFGRRGKEGIDFIARKVYTLRLTFKTEMETVLKGGSSTWEFFSELMFLKDHIKYNTSDHLKKAEMENEKPEQSEAKPNMDFFEQLMLFSQQWSNTPTKKASDKEMGIAIEKPKTPSLNWPYMQPNSGSNRTKTANEKNGRSKPLTVTTPSKTTINTPTAERNSIPLCGGEANNTQLNVPNDETQQFCDYLATRMRKIPESQQEELKDEINASLAKIRKLQQQ